MSSICVMVLLLLTVPFCFTFTTTKACLGGKLSLSSGSYKTSCPDVEAIIFSGVEQAVFDDPRMAASLLRLHFHDCFVNVSKSDHISMDHAWLLSMWQTCILIDEMKYVVSIVDGFSLADNVLDAALVGKLFIHTWNVVWIGVGMWCFGVVGWHRQHCGGEDGRAKCELS